VTLFVRTLDFLPRLYDIEFDLQVLWRGFLTVIVFYTLLWFPRVGRNSVKDETLFPLNSVPICDKNENV
jgi:hypothetical protein